MDGAAAASLSVPIRRLSAGGSVDVPRVRMNANTAAIAAAATIAALIALRDRCGFRAARADAFR
ncbi:hypothetical protein GCM10009804_14050 [Kribbella hippodromi]|uniref:Uncharacterized protein n=1 Tax=Kribbella hippodromi TaxID=434347 RepID=A0ABP4NFI2_9ACTN